jgi:hypothetical protein
VKAKGNIRESTIAPHTRKSNTLSSFVAMYKILTEMLKTIAEQTKTMSNDLLIANSFRHSLSDSQISLAITFPQNQKLASKDL